MQEGAAVEELADFRSHGDGLPLLYLAVRHNNLQLVKAIVSCTQISNSNTDIKKRSVAQFIWNEHKCIDIEIVQFLHEREIISDSDFFVLACAIGFSAGETNVNEFVTNYIKRNGVNVKGTETTQLPIYAASRGGQKLIVSMLLENNADVVPVNADGETALWASCVEDQIDIAKLLLEKANTDSDTTIYVNQADHDEKTPIWICACLSHNNILVLLLKYNPNIDMPDSN